MRKVTYGGATSLDNYLARTDDAVDWLMWSDEAATVMNDYFKTIDTMVMGRKTYDVSVRMAQGDGGNYPGITTYICSRTLQQETTANAPVIARDAVALVRRLKAEDGKDICLMGGGDLARSLFEADLIDEVGFNIHPVLLGDGIPAFHRMTRQIDLELVSSRPFKNGCVLVTYRVKR